jgi:hypothetical protein
MYPIENLHFFHNEQHLKNKMKDFKTLKSIGIHINSIGWYNFAISDVN